MVIVFPLRVTLNSPFTKGSQPARYCHCVPRINRDNSFPLSSYSVGTTENSSRIVSLFCQLLIVTGTSLTVPRECDLLATPIKPMNLLSVYFKSQMLCYIFRDYG